MFMAVPRFYEVLVSKGLEITVCMSAYSVPSSASTVVKPRSCNQYVTFLLFIFDIILYSIVSGWIRWCSWYGGAWWLLFLR
jgi:hypothetical protein